MINPISKRILPSFLLVMYNNRRGIYMNYKKTIVSILLVASLFTLSACKEKEVVKPVEKKEEPQRNI